MPLETATYIDDLVDTNPVGTDAKSQGDDHIKLLKTVLQNQFTALGSAAVTVTAAELNSIPSLFLPPSVVDISDAGATITWNVTTAPYAKITLDSNKTFAAPAGLTIGWKYLIITQGGTARNITWNAAYKMPGRSGGFPPDLGAAGETTVVAGFYDGTSFWVGYTPY
jgi:hypothetical protein